MLMNPVLKYILFLFVFSGLLTAQQYSSFQSNFPEPKYEYFNINNGLPNNSVTSILQDHLGYLWFGTLNGLVKFDGHIMKVYQPDSDDTLSLNNRRITFIFEDQFGLLWIGTNTGLNLYNRKNENFTRYLNSNTIRTMTEDSFGNLWIAANNGLYLFNKHQNIFTHYKFEELGYVYDIEEDRVNSLLYLGTNTGLYTLDPENRVSNKLLLNNNNTGAVYSLYKTSDGTIWIGCDNGLARLNHQDGELSFHKGINLPVRVMVQDDDGNLWCYTGSHTWGSTGNELVILDPETDNYKRMNSILILSMYKDYSGIVWLGGAGEGLLKWDKNKWKFKAYRNKEAEKDNFVWTVYIDPTGTMWLGTKNGLDRIDRKTGVTKHYNFNNTEIKVIHDDGSGYLWLGAFKQGLIRFDPVRETFKYYNPDLNDSTSLSGDHVTSIWTDSLGTMWVGTRYDGLNRFEKNSEKFKHYKSNPKISGSLSNSNIFYLLGDRDGYLWICTDYGINRYDPGTDRFTSIKIDDADQWINQTTSVFEDNKGNIWLSTFFTGFHLFDKENFVSLKNYTEKNGLTQNTIANIKEDSSGNLWIKTFSGISKFNPQTETFRHYDVSDGLPEDMTKVFEVFQDFDGEFFFGSTNGYFSFHPNIIKDDPVTPKVIISNLSLFNRPDETLNYGGYISELKEINLPYHHNDLRFDFVGLHYGEPAKNKYKFMLENFDADWVDAGTQRNATYTNLSPGDYVFRVIACNRDGVWNEEGASLKIIISPPFWATWWAYSLYVIFFGLILYGLRRYEMNRVNLKNQVKLDEVMLKEKEETDKMKSRFFANISHEFRTPLTLILGPAEKINSQTSNDIIKDSGIIKRNSKRLLQLVNQLLDLSRLEAGKLKLQASKGNIVAFVRGLTMSFESLAERKDIKLKVTAEQNDIEVYFDRDKMAKILANLLSNAFKFTNDGGTIEVRIEQPTPKSPPEEGTLKGALSPPLEGRGVGQMGHSVKKFVTITVRDTGIGISEEELPKLFDRFYQVDSSQTREHEGTGIGLALTKELVELHHGHIRVTSEVGNPDKVGTGGSEFIVQLPVGREHLKDGEFIELDEKENVILTPHERGKNLPELIDENILIDSSSPPLADPQNDNEDDKDKTIILVVEDNADVREYIKDSLGNNFKIEEASNGELGVRKAEETIPDLIISDIMMPKMDGNELTRRIKNDERTSHIPVILLTAKSEQESKLEGLETGADDYLTKPFDTKELLIRIKNLINIRRKLQEKFSGEKIIARKVEKKLSILDERFLSKVLEVAEKHLSEESFSIEEFGNEVGMGRVQLHRKLKALTGKSPSLYLRSVRLAKAKKMIEEKQGNISEIAYSVGFSTPIYFTKCFKEEFGYTPSDLMH
jgi:signal transduction histidine kinase/ligand-binding sensor domain-containing protein/DNA-binding response OmpR family regulator